MAINENPAQTGGGPCATTASVEVYSSATFLNITSGDRIYYDATLQTDVTGSGYIGIAENTSSNNLPSKQAYLQQGGLLSMTTCAPIPPPVTSYEYKATSGFLSSTGPCTDFLDAYTFYSSRSDWSQFQSGDVIYTDAGLSNVSFLGGNGLVYGVGDSSMTYPSQSWSMVSGQLTNNYSCAGVPTPPPPVPISTYYRYELYPCTGSGAIYRNSNVSHSLNKVIQLAGASTQTNCFEINSVQTFGGTVTEGLEPGSYTDCSSCTGAAPTPTAKKRFEVSFSKTERILLPAAIFIPSLIISIPYKNIPKPPNKLVNIKNIETSFGLEPADEDAISKEGIAPKIIIDVSNIFFILSSFLLVI